MASGSQPTRPISGLSMRREAWDDTVSRQETRPLSPVREAGPSQITDKNILATHTRAHSAHGSEGTYSAIPYPNKLQLAMICIGLLLGNSLVALDTSIIASAIPTITSDFQSIDDVSWYGSVYLLILTAFQPSYGRIYRLFNRKFAYITAVTIFEAGSLLCAMARYSPVFILGRAVAGIGAAGILQGALITVHLSVPPHKRAVYTTLLSSIFGISACFAPIVGGLLTDKLSWRWCFWINLPVGGVSIIFNMLFFQQQKDVSENEKMSLFKKLKQLEFAGGITIIAAFVCLVLALQWVGTMQNWKSPTIIGLLFGFVVLLVIFSIIQWKQGEYAIIPPRIFSQRTVFGGAWYFFFMQAVLVTHTYFLPFYFQLVQGVSVTQSGIRNTPYPLLTIFGFFVSGVLVWRVGYCLPFVGLGAIIASVGSGMITTLGTWSTTFHWAGYQALVGFGVGLGLQLPFSAIPVVLNDHDAPVGNEVTIFLGLLGGAFSLPIIQAVFINVFISELPKHMALDPWMTLRFGVTNMHKLADGDDLEILIRVYSTALQKAFFIPMVAAAAAFISGLVMEWRNVNKARVIRDNEAVVLEETLQ